MVHQFWELVSVKTTLMMLFKVRTSTGSAAFEKPVLAVLLLKTSTGSAAFEKPALAVLLLKNQHWQCCFRKTSTGSAALEKPALAVLLLKQALKCLERLRLECQKHPKILRFP